jgi:hypothetical protein
LDGEDADENADENAGERRHGRAVAERKSTHGDSIVRELLGSGSSGGRRLRAAAT